MFRKMLGHLRRAAGSVTRGSAALGLAAALALGAVASNDADAKRVGGAQSIGRQQSQTAPPSGQAPRSQAQPAQQGAQPAAAAGNRWMGPLAGLAAGLGIAALLSSFGLGEGLAQLVANALLIGLAIAAGVALLRSIANRRRPHLADAHGVAGRQRTGGAGFFDPPAQARDRTGAYARPPLVTTDPPAAARGIAHADPALEPGQPAFVESAKAIFMRLQRAWDANEQGDLFELTTPDMFARLKLDLEARGREPSRTEVAALDAEILGTQRNADETLVSVRFYGQMREDDAPSAQPFEEIWNLLRTTGDTAWRLAGIQQIER
jgi:predicted lipid-binding transport protein (Tim44 family)